MFLPLDALDSPARLRAFFAPEVALLTLFERRAARDR
jgi:hypothetical protein